MRLLQVALGELVDLALLLLMLLVLFGRQQPIHEQQRRLSLLELHCTRMLVLMMVGRECRGQLVQVRRRRRLIRRSRKVLLCLKLVMVWWLMLLMLPMMMMMMMLIVLVVVLIFQLIVMAEQRLD